MMMAPSQDDINERKELWQVIKERRDEKERLDERGNTSKELTCQTPYSQDLIERGIGGEPVPITDEFLRACVNFFGLISVRVPSGRTKYEEPTSRDELIALLKRAPAPYPHQYKLWDDWGSQ